MFLDEMLYMAKRRREAVAHGREWLLDCFGEPEDVEGIKLLNAVGVVRAVEIHFDGGWEEFLRGSDNLKDEDREPHDNSFYNR